MLWLLVGCMFTEPSSEQSKPDRLSNEQQVDAALQASRAAPKLSGWSGDWTVSVWASDTNHPVVTQLASQLFSEVRQWNGGTLSGAAGEVVLVFLDEGELPTQPLRGEVVFVVNGRWSDQDIARLPWLGGAVVQPQKLINLFDSPRHLSDPAILAGLSAWQIAEHYDLKRRALVSAVPVGLRGILTRDVGSSNDPDPRVRALASEGSQDRQMVVRLATARNNPDANVVDRLAKDVDPWVRARALDRTSNISLLALGLNDPSSLVRVIAAHRLATLASEGRDGVRVELEKAALSTDAYVRWKAAYGLGFGASSSVLVQMLEDADVDVQRQAAKSLQKIGDSSATLALKKVVKSNNSFVRRWALEGLGAIKSEEVRSILLERYENSGTVLEQEAAAKALLRQGVSVSIPRYQPPSPPRSLQEIERYVASKDATVRKDIAKFLAGREGVATYLHQLAKDKDSEVRKSAVEAMGWNGDVAVYEHLSDPDLDVLITALDGIRRSSIGDGRGIVSLLQHPDAEVRLRAAQALASLVNLSTQQEQALQAMAEDPDERIRASALQVFPEKASSTEVSGWVRYVVSKERENVLWSTDCVMAAWAARGDVSQQAWLNGIIQFEDDLLHQRFSWNDPSDKPATHKSLRPPLMRPYGQPNRG